MKPYDVTKDPPAMMMEAEVFNPHSLVFEKLPAKLDTGADISVIPQQLTKRLGLVPLRTVTGHDYNCREEEHRTYLVHLSLNGRRFEHVEVITTPGQEILVGRDILNGLKIVLDGKHQSFDIEDP
jgi:predicted aspartyl protease